MPLCRWACNRNIFHSIKTCTITLFSLYHRIAWFLHGRDYCVKCETKLDSQPRFSAAALTVNIFSINIILTAVIIASLLFSNLSTSSFPPPPSFSLASIITCLSYTSRPLSPSTTHLSMTCGSLPGTHPLLTSTYIFLPPFPSIQAGVALLNRFVAHMGISSQRPGLPGTALRRRS